MEEKKQSLNNRIKNLENWVNHLKLNLDQQTIEVQNIKHSKHNKISFICSDFGLEMSGDASMNVLEKKFNKQKEFLFKHHKINQKGI